MRHYECECMKCSAKRQAAFKLEPYPEIGDVFLLFCPSCNEETRHTRVLTRKAAAELRRKQQEADLRNSIAERCAEYGFKHRFLYQSVSLSNIIRTRSMGRILAPDFISLPVITHSFKLEDIEEAYRVFENKLDGVIKIAITPN